MRRVVVLIAVVVAGGLLVWGYTLGRGERALEAQLEAPIKTRPHVSTTPAGDQVVTLTPAQQRRFGISTAVLGRATFKPHHVAYGALQADPARRFVLRSPIGGVLQAAGDRTWPDVGTVLAGASELARVSPILSPTDRVDLTARLVKARADVEEQQARLAAARSAYQRKAKLNAEGGLVAQREVEQARATLQAAQAHLEAATASVKLIESVLATTDSASARAVRLSGRHRGEVVEVLAHPGEVVTPGQPLLVVANFERLIARVELPGGEGLARMPSSARIVVLGHEDHPLAGKPIAPADVRPGSRGQAFLFAVDTGGLPIRPGAAVTAYLEDAGEPLEGVDVPRAAVVRAAGAAWVFLWDGATRFTRREIRLEHATPSGWFVTASGLRDARVVVSGAQLLLSETLKSEIRVGEEQR